MAYAPQLQNKVLGSFYNCLSLPLQALVPGCRDVHCWHSWTFKTLGTNSKRNWGGVILKPGKVGEGFDARVTASADTVSYSFKGSVFKNLFHILLSIF